jgi:cob(I)alamin adenosyltransferase
VDTWLTAFGGAIVRCARRPATIVTIARGSLDAPAEMSVGRIQRRLEAVVGVTTVTFYTRTGDDGTTGLLHGGRVGKDGAIPGALGAVDEAQSAIGVARSLADGDVHTILTKSAADLWTVMAEIAENPERAHAMTDDLTDRVAAIERAIDDVATHFEMPTEFVIPGATLLSAYLDVARAAVRRAERSAIRAASNPHVVVYLNRLSGRALMCMVVRS